MSIGLALAVRNARLQVIIDKMDAGVDDGVIRFYNAPRPATGGAVTTLIGENKLFDPSGSVDNALLTFNLISDELAVRATEDVVWCRVVDGDGNFVIDMGCGIEGSGAEVIFDVISAVIGGKITILSSSLQEGNL